jgi:tRNA (pseudouridine54-N1)-methyltransferase
MREFVVVAHKVPWDGDFSLNDLTGSGGRVDLVARAIGAAFLFSNGIRKDTRAHLVVNTNPKKPRSIRFESDKLRYLNPDERNTSSLIRNALIRCPDTGDVESSPGVFSSRKGFADVLGDCQKPIVWLVEGAKRPDWSALRDATFVISDQQDLTPDEAAIVKKFEPIEAGLGERSLHTDHCVVVVNHYLESAEG